jgi:malonyl CoA-acyl carrier protein transacylase
MCQNYFLFQIGKTFPVIGAPYTGLMRPSEQSMVQALKDVELGTAHINVYSNYLGKIYPRRKAMIRQCIFRQFSNPIKWEQIICLIRGKVKDGATCSSFIKASLNHY